MGNMEGFRGPMNIAEKNLSSAGMIRFQGNHAATVPLRTFEARLQMPVSDEFIRTAQEVYFSGEKGVAGPKGILPTTRRGLIRGLSVLLMTGSLAACGPDSTFPVGPGPEPPVATCTTPSGHTVSPYSILNVSNASWEAGIGGFSPQVASAPALNIAHDRGDVVLSWLSSPQGRYRIEVSDDLRNWATLEEFRGTGETMILRRPMQAEREFYRLVNLSAQHTLSGRESVVRIPLNGEALMCDVSRISLEIPVENPATGYTEYRSVPVKDARLEGQSLALLVDGPVSRGAELTLENGALLSAQGDAAVGTVQLDGNLMSTILAARWFKAFEVGDVNLFPSTVFSNSIPPQGIPQPTDPAVVFSELNAHFQNFLDHGWLTSDDVGSLLQRFQDPWQRQVFTNPENGVFEPQLMAAVLATAGTPSFESIAAIIDGANQVGRPARVVYGELPQGLLGGASVRPDPIDGQARWFITVHPVLKNEPFQAVSGLLGHEAFHQDDDEGVQGQDEEIVARIIETNTWKQQLLANPALARINTPLARFNNLNLLLYENSGSTLPKGGIFEAPLLQNPPDIVPESDAINHASLEDYLRQVAYEKTPDIPTPGNDYLDTVVSWATGTIQTGLDFNRSTVEVLDNSQFFTDEEDAEILRILALKPAQTSKGPQFA